MGRTLAEKALMKWPLMHVNTTGKPSPMVVAALPSVNHHQEFVEGNAWTGRWRSVDGHPFIGAVPFNIRGRWRFQFRIVLKPHTTFAKFDWTPR
tara:strand:+ start:608 stop:889 length:282 start_codon:yes stop_codon:yes gene_type:complete